MRKLLLYKILAMLLCCGTVSAQISGYHEEGFEMAAFPPAGWQQQSVYGTGTWVRATDAFHSGLASAYMTYDASQGEDWLITPQFDVTQLTDSVTFWMLLDFQGYSPDSLAIRVSTTDDQLASFSTIMLLEEGVNYPPNSTAWVRYAVSLEDYVGQQVYIAFAHYNEDGDGLYIDDITIGTTPDNDVTPLSIDVQNSIGTTSMSPQGTVKNVGLLSQTFDVELSAGTYTSAQTVTLAPGATTQVTFDPWTPAVGSVTLQMVTQLPGDENPENDTIELTINVLTEFDHGAWTQETAVSVPRWGSAPAFAMPCVSDADTGRIYVIGGYDAAFNNSTANIAYNVETNTWETKAALPVSRGQLTPVQVNNKIYVIGGYAGSFAPVTNTDIYDVLTDSWSAGAAIPLATGDYGIFTYGDSLIYVIGGYNGTTDINNVQIYNINSDSWTTGTAKPGTAVSGGRAGVSGNTIVFAGGYNQLDGQLPFAYRGEISTSDPTQITWTAIGDYPAGPVGRHAAGTTIDYNGKVYFGGGDPDGQGIDVMNKVYAYNTLTDSWETGPDMLHGASNISAFAGVIKNDTSYLVTACGYDGAAIPGYMEWLKIGPVSDNITTPDTMICSGGDITLMAQNGTAYAWYPDASLSDTSIANPVASPSVATTYYVDVTARYGCPVTDSVTVDVIVITAASENDTIVSDCTGELMVSATGGSGPYTYLWDDAAQQNTETAVLLCAGEYSVIVTDANGCTDTVSAEVISFVGLIENGMIEVSIYPNPVTNVVTIQLPMNSGVHQISLKDVSGKELLSHKMDQKAINTQLDLSAFPAGMYFLEFSGADGHFTKAITKR